MLRKILRTWFLLSGIFIFLQTAVSAQSGAPMRRVISPNQPAWFLHIDSWNHADPQKLIDLVPADIRPYVIFNISISIWHDPEREGNPWLQTEYGYEVAKSWLRVCAENRVWAMLQQSSGGFQHLSETDLTQYEEFYREYPNFLGFNYAEQFWGFDGAATDWRSPSWTGRFALFAKLLKLSNQYGGYLTVSWCPNQWNPNINPIAMLKRNPDFAAACRDYTENYIIQEKYTQQTYQHDMESTCLGAYLSGYAGNYGIRYDSTGWSDATGTNANFMLATGGAPQLEHAMLTGQTVIDGPETIPTQATRELGTATTGDGFTFRRWEFFRQCVNTNLDYFRKIVDGTVRIPTRQEVIDRTKVVIIANQNSGNNQTQYSSPQTLFEGLYRMDGDGNYENNKSFFKKTGRYPTIPTVYLLDDAPANSFQVKVNKSDYNSRWPTIASKQTEFNSLFPSEYTGDIYAGRHENGWVVYNPYKTDQTASGTIPFKYNTAGSMELVLSRYNAGVVKEYADKVTFYLNNYTMDSATASDRTLKANTIRINGASSEPTWSFVNRGAVDALVPTVTSSWSGGVLTLTIMQNGPVDITVNCSGTATGRLTAYTPSGLTLPVPPPPFAGPRQHEAEVFEWRNLTGGGGNTANAVNGSIRNYTGQGYLRFGTNSAARIRRNVSVLSSGTYRLETRYSVTGGNVNTIDLYVNGTRVNALSFTATSSLADWAVNKQTVTLNAGVNTIEYRATAAAPQNVHFDNIVIHPTVFENGLVIQEHDAGFGSVDGTIDSTGTGFTGTGFANTNEAAGAGIDWWLDFPAEGTGAFTFRYSSLVERVADLYVNGVKVASNVLFPATGSLSSWEFIAAHGAVPAGLTNVRLQAVSTTGLPNIDYLGVGGDTAYGITAPLEDTYVRNGGSASTNYGNDAQLVTKTDSADGFSRQSYLKFDVSSLATAQSVQLKLVPFQVDAAGTSLAYELLTDDSWSENTLTWNNQPVGSGPIIATVGGYVVGQTAVIDVTAAAKAEAAGDGILTLRISNPTTGNNFVGFHSSQSTTAAFRPVLEYTVSVPTVRAGAVKWAYLRLDDAAGATATDSTGNGWDGTLVNGPAWVAGAAARVNGALDFAGVDQLNMPAGIVGDVDDFTLSFWVKPGTVVNDARVFEFGDGGTENRMYFTPRTTGGQARFALSIGGVEQAVEVSSGTHFTAGTWTHVTVTLEDDTASLYINGVEVAANEAMTHLPSGLGITAVNRIGGDSFTGTVDEFRIYKGVLSAADVVLLAAVPATPAGITTVASSSKVTLNWSAVAGATGYTVRRSTAPDGSYTVVGTSTSTSFTDSSADNGTVYYYTVTAGNGVSESSASAPVEAAPGPLHLHLRFDEGSGTASTDSTGNGWNATLVNGTGWTTGRIGGALNPTGGGNQHAALPNGVVSTLTEFTVSFWLRPGSSAISTWARVFDFSTGSTGSSMYFVPRTGGGLIRFGLSGQNLEAPSNVQFASNTWTHVAVTLSGNTATMYINGSSVATITTMTNRPMGLGTTTFNYIGRSASSADPYLNAAVDEFLIYGVPLSASEIATLAAVPASPPNLTATSGSGAVTLNWGAVTGASGYQIRRSTTSGGPYTAVGSVSGSATSYNDTAVVPGTTYHYVVAITGGVGLGSVSAQASAAPGSPALPPAPSGLVATAVSPSRIDLSWSPVAGASAYRVKRSATSGGPYTTIAANVTGTAYSDIAGLAENTTYHYVVSASNATGEGPNSSQASAATSTKQAWLHLAFDESSGASAADSSGNGRHGTLVNGPSRAEGWAGNAVVLDGVDDHVTFPSGVVNGLQACTIAAWVKLDTVSAWSRVFDFGTGTAANMFLAPQGGSNVVRFAITNSGGGSEQQVNGTAPLPAGEWVHVAVTLDGTTGRIYVNGVESGSGPVTLTPADLGNTTNNYLGRSQYSDPYLDGMIDEFQIHNFAMNATEVQELLTHPDPQLPDPPDAPSSLTASAASADRIDLVWGASEGADSYTVSRSTVPGGPYETVATGVTATSHADTGDLTAGIRYYYVVSAVNEGGESSGSAEASAVPSVEIEPEEYRIANVAMTGGDVRLTVPASVAGHNYRLLASETLSDDWQPVGDVLQGTGGELEFSVPYEESKPKRFFKLEVQRQ